MDPITSSSSNIEKFCEKFSKSEFSQKFNTNEERFTKLEQLPKKISDIPLGQFNKKAQAWKKLRNNALIKSRNDFKQRVIDSDPLSQRYDNLKKEKARLFVKAVRDEHLEEMKNLIFTSASLESNRAQKEKVRRQLKLLNLKLHQVFISPWEVQYWLLCYHKKNNSLSINKLPKNTYIRLKQVEDDILSKKKHPIFARDMEYFSFQKGITPTI